MNTVAPTLPMGSAHIETVSVPIAVDLTGKSRRTIMRAIKHMELRAQKNNENHWRIVKEDLMQWASPIGHAHLNMPTSPTPLAIDLEVKLAVAVAQRDAAKEQVADLQKDRDRWREMAEKLAEKPRRRWWWR